MCGKEVGPQATRKARWLGASRPRRATLSMETLNPKLAIAGFSRQRQQPRRGVTRRVPTNATFSRCACTRLYALREYHERSCLVGLNTYGLNLEPSGRIFLARFRVKGIGLGAPPAREASDHLLLFNSKLLVGCSCGPPHERPRRKHGPCAKMTRTNREL